MRRLSSSRWKSGLSCTKCHNYFHLSCIKPRISANTARILLSWRCSDCHFGTVTSPVEPSITGATSSEPVFDPIGVLISAVYTRQTNRVILRIPKSCRIQAASALSDTINALSSQAPISCTKFFFFAKEVFGIPTQSGNDHRTSKTAQKINDNLRRHLFTSSTDIPCQLWQLIHSPSYNRRPSATDDPKRLRQMVNRHLSVNDVAAAVRAVASDDILCDIIPDVLESQQSKHPPAPSNIEIIPIPTYIPSMTISSQDIREAIRSFSGSSGGGVDCLRPIHLHDLISNQAAEAGNRLIFSLTSLVNTFLNGQISDFARILFFHANLTALTKKDGGIRPIAVGNILRRLASKVANHFATHKVSNFLRPVQLGVSVKNACEAAVHFVRIIAKSPDHIQAKLDIPSAFNNIQRDILLRKCLMNYPEIFRLASLAYGSPTALMANGNLIWSDSGVQQGDPLGPLLFSLAIHDIASSMKSNFNIWYLDDATNAGDPKSVCDDIRRCSCMLTDIGLFLNPSKSELVNLGLDEAVFLSETQCINSILENVSFVEKEDVILYSSPLTSTAIRPQFQHKLSIFKALTENISLLDRHPAYFLLKNSFSMPKLM